MGEHYMLIESAIDWSALKPESSPNFTLLNSAISLYVWGGCQRKWRRADLSGWLGGSGRMPACSQTFGIFIILYIVFPLRPMPWNVNHVRSWHKKSGPRENVWVNKEGQERCLVFTVYLCWIFAIKKNMPSSLCPCPICPKQCQPEFLHFCWWEASTRHSRWANFPHLCFVTSKTTSHSHQH